MLTKLRFLRDRGSRRFNVVTTEWLLACIDRNERIKESYFTPDTLSAVRYYERSTYKTSFIYHGLNQCFVFLSVSNGWIWNHFPLRLNRAINY